ncbi:MAG: phenylalanine--tRNA ligase subunit beta [Cytophagales bacterium]|nr:phenylalanine--tRNA ligase subunit beta [Cytophagales bacterium]
MKISLNWLKDFIEINETPDELDELLTQTGLEVEGVEKIEMIPGGLEGVVIGEVLTCEKHPNADKLKVTTVDIGGESTFPIVCGAPNVAVGQRVVVATVNSTLYPMGGDSFKIKKAKIRGEISEGMICAEDELGLGSDHDGIIVLDTDLPNGTPAADYFHPEQDLIYEIGLTPNRGDATSHIGTARDIKAMTGREINWPLLKELKVNIDRPIEVVIENADGCPRYSGVTIRGVEVKESPDWLKWRLRAIDLEPINNIVDVTNYVCHGLGQPLHAFDADKIKGGKVVVRTVANGTKFTTLDDKERTLHDKDLMVCDEKEGMCIAGVFGGAGSGIQGSTKNIFLESAYFSPDYIRNSVQRHGLTTDASFRFERGADPERTVDALKFATQLIIEVAGGSVASEIVDIYKKVEPVQIPTTFQNFHRLIGKALPNDQIVSILQSLEIEITKQSVEGFTAGVPSFRNDVTREADLVEEVLRIYGFNNIELEEHSNANYLAEFNEFEPYRVRQQLTNFLAGSGYHEILTNSIVHPDYGSKARVNDREAIEILNKSSEDLALMKTSPVHSGLEVIRHNINRRMPNLKLFELSKTYHKKGEAIIENPYLCLYLTGKVEEENWMRPSSDTSFQDIMGAVGALLQSIRIKNFSQEPLEPNDLFSNGLILKADNTPLGHMGTLQTKLTSYFDVKQTVFYAELNWNQIMKMVGGQFKFEELSKFPEVRRDLSLVVDKSISFERIQHIAFKSAKKLLTRVNIFSVYEGDKIQNDKKSYAVSFFLQDKSKTLNDKVIDKMMVGLMKDFENELDAIIRK